MNKKKNNKEVRKKSQRRKNQNKTPLRRSQKTKKIFSKKDIDRILELNQLDLEVYEYVQKSKKRY